MTMEATEALEEKSARPVEWLREHHVAAWCQLIGPDEGGRRKSRTGYWVPTGYSVQSQARTQMRHVAASQRVAGRRLEQERQGRQRSKRESSSGRARRRAAWEAGRG